MYKWERREAENITKTEHRRGVRRKIDLDYQNHLRRQGKERADVKVKREILAPSPPSSQSNKFKTRTYDRPWAQGVAAGKKVLKPFPCSYGKSASSETRSSWNKGSVSCLPAISSGTQSKTAELAVTSKIPHRGKASLASNCNKEHPVQYHNKPRSVDEKGRVLKVSTRAKTNKPTQSQDILKGKNKMKHLHDRANISTRKDPVCTSTLKRERHSLPQPLMSFTRHSDTHWPRLLTLHRRPLSPVDDDEPALQLIPDPFEGFSEASSIIEELEDISSEDTYREEFFTVSGDTTTSSVVEFTDCECLCSAGTLVSSPGDSDVVPLSSLLPTLNMLSSESEGEEADDDLSASWQDKDRESYYIPVQWSHSQSSSASTSPSHSACSLHSLQSLSSQSSTSRISGRASVSSDGYSLMPPLAQTRPPHTTPLPPITDRVNRDFVASSQQTDQHLPELVGRPQTTWLTAQTRMATPPRTSLSRRQFILANRPEEGEITQERSSYDCTDDSSLSPGEVSGPTTPGEMDHLTLMTLMTLHDIHANIEHFEEQEVQEGGATAGQEAHTVTHSNSEALHRLKERLLEESSDEEEGDQCRICQSGASSLTNPLLTPCLCSGSLQFIHHDCLKRWIQTKILSGSELFTVKTCELCKGSLTLDLDDFDVDDYYQRHRQQQQVEDVNNDLYMLLVLQQRFSVLLQISLSNTDMETNPPLSLRLGMRASRAGQRSNPTPGTSDT